LKKKVTCTVTKLNHFLSSVFWINGLSRNGFYVLVNKSSGQHDIEIGFTDDGDAWVLVLANSGTEIAVTKEQPEIYKALTVLAHATELDNTRRAEFIENEIDALLMATSLISDGSVFPNLVVGKIYSRTHDDCDGDLSESLAIRLNSDKSLSVWAKSRNSLRFRIPLFGGGASGRVRNALMVLALAIKISNESCKSE
jgi:hypothetical protein